jgi:hypothetical protein
MFYIKQKYGSVMDFVLTERLHWDADDLKPRGPAFEHDGMRLKEICMKLLLIV